MDQYCVFYFEENHQDAAYTLAKLLAEPDEAATSPLLIDENPKKVNVQDKIVIYAHSANFSEEEDKLVAERTPEELAKTLAETIQNVSLVNEVIVLACEAGLYNEIKNATYAKRFRDALVKKGFNSNISLRAANAPKGAYSMRVRVTAQAGTAVQAEARSDGNVEAYYYINRYSELLDQVIETLKENIDKEGLNKQALIAEKERLEKEKEQAEKEGSFQRITFLSTNNFQETLKEDRFTYTKNKTPAPIDPEAAKTLAQLNQIIYEISLEDPDSKNSKLTEIQDDYAKAYKKLRATACDKLDPAKESMIRNLYARVYELIKSENSKKISDAEKYLKYLEGDILIIRQSNTADLPTAIDKIEKKHAPAWLSRSTYYNGVIRNLRATFKDHQAVPPISTPESKQPRIKELEARLKELSIPSRNTQPSQDTQVQATRNYKQTTTQYPTAGNCIKELQNYINKRNSESLIRTIRNFFGFIFFKLFAVDSRIGDIKVKVAEKLINLLQSGKPIQEKFEENEVDALKQGRLGEIIKKHPGINEIFEHNSQSQDHYSNVGPA